MMNTRRRSVVPVEEQQTEAKEAVPLKCCLCNFKTSDLEKLATHSKVIHGTNSKNMPVSIVSKRPRLKDEEPVEVKKTCAECGKPSSEVPEKNLSYVCESCNFKTSQLKNFEVHAKRKHKSVVKEVTCSTCNKSNYKLAKDAGSAEEKSNPDWLSPSDNHGKQLKSRVVFKPSKPKNLTCGQCNFKAENGQQLDKHNAEHHFVSYLCDECGFSSKTPLLMKQHKIIMHFTKKSLKNRPRPTQSGQQIIYPPNSNPNIKERIKKEPVELPGWVSRHPLIKKMNQAPPVMPEEKKTEPMKCHLCSMEAYDLKRLDKHVEVCHGSGSKNKSDKRDNMRSGRGMFGYDEKCLECGLNLNETNYAYLHRVKSSSCACELCDFKTSRLSFLMSHVKQKHKVPMVDVRCSTCNKFNYKLPKILDSKKEKSTYNFRMKLDSRKTGLETDIFVKAEIDSEVTHVCHECGFSTNSSHAMESHRAYHKMIV